MTALPPSIVDAAKLLRARKTSSLELTEAALSRAHADRFNTWLLLADDHARAQAKAADARIAGPRGRHGAPARRLRSGRRRRDHDLRAHG